MVNYLNVAPILEKWRDSVHNPDWEMVEATPSELCRMLAGNEVHLGFVSSFEYGAHPDNYKILPGLSISANGSVGSVFLFSHVPLKQLDKADILLTSQSETSVRLAKIILEEFSGVRPVYARGEISAAEGDIFQAVLAIGDEALRLVDTSKYLYQFDLGDIWKRETGLPFVFAVCAVQKRFCEEKPEMLVDIHRELLRCRDEGKDDLPNICRIAAPRIPMSEKRCHDYLTAIEYDLNSEKRKALEKFFSYLIKRGEVSEKALPLDIYVPDF